MLTTKKSWINALLLVVTLFFNTLGSLGIINGLSQKAISDMFTTLITPISSTFAIWSVIYSLLIISMIVMIVKKNNPYYKSAVNKITMLFRISCLLNIAWIIAFSYLQILISVVFILGFVIVLSKICLELRKIQVGKYFLLPLTFGLYTGWVLIATVVNISLALVKLNWNGFGIADEVWAVITLIIAVILVFIVQKSNTNTIIPLPVAWGYWGIYQYLRSPEGFQGKFGFLQITCLVGIVVLIGISAIRLYQNHFELVSFRSNN